MIDDDRIAVTVKTAARMVDRTRQFMSREITSGRLKAHRAHPKADPLILVDDLRSWLKGEGYQPPQDRVA